MASAKSLTFPRPDDRAAAVLADAHRAARNGRTRMVVLARDLFQEDAIRVDEARRTRLRTMLDQLVRAVEGRLRRDLVDRLEPVAPAGVRMALGNMTMPVTRPWLDQAGLLDDPDLVAVLARRVDEHRLVIQARIAALQDPELAGDLFARLLNDPDTGVAAAAAAVAEQVAGRFGRFDEPVVGPSDLPDAVHARLVWRMAAAIRHWIGLDGMVSLVAADRAIAAAAAAALAPAPADEPRGLDVAALGLARAMLRVGAADDDATVALAAEGQVAVAVAGLALRAGVAMPVAWDMVLDPDGARLLLLLRAARVERAAAAALLLRWPDAAAPVETIADRMAGYDALTAAAAQTALEIHRLDPDYLSAIDALATGLAQA